MDLSVSTKAGNPLKENVEVKKEEPKKEEQPIIIKSTVNEYLVKEIRDEYGYE